MDAAATAPHVRQLWSVQVLRALAALMVVIGHSQSAVAELEQGIGRSFTRLTILPWGASVDLFFVISGFIMIYASRKLFGQAGARRTFLKGRLTRIVPPYWIATTLTLGILIAATIKGGDPMPTVPGIIASYLFVPWDTWGTRHIFPLLDLGWTLNYEMFFYASFALFVGWPRDRAVGGVIALLLALVLIGGFVPEDWAALHFWTRPILADFGIGAAVGLLCGSDVKLDRPLRLALLIGGGALLVLDPAGLFRGPLGFTVANGWPRVMLAGLPAAAMLAGAVLGPEPRMPRLLLPAVLLGDASYSLYLFHPFMLIGMEKMAQKSAVVRGLPPALLVWGTMIGALVIAWVAHRWIERPATRLAHRLANRPPPAPAPAARPAG